MYWLLWTTYAPAVAGLVASAVLFFVAHARGRVTALDTSTRTVALTAVVGVLILSLARRYVALGVLPTPGLLAGWTGTFTDIRWVLPLGAGLAAMIALCFPLRRHTATGAADLGRRTATSFTSRWWLVALAALITIVVSLTVAAGLASEPDEQGRYTTYLIDVGSAGIGTTIYGWYYSLPCLILLTVLLITSAIALVLIARPGFGRDHETEVAIRTQRSRVVIMGLTGAITLHLGVILESLAATGSVHGAFAGGNDTVFLAWTPFSALSAPLRVGGFLTTASGYALWFGSVALICLGHSSRRVR